MLVFLIHDPEAGHIMIRGRLESAAPRGVGHLVVQVRPGESYKGYTYEHLVKLGTGTHDLVFPRPASSQQQAS
jgi:hypothetical protein